MDIGDAMKGTQFVTSQEGIRKWYLGVAKCYDFPQGWESEELDTKHPLHESFVQGAEH